MRRKLLEDTSFKESQMNLTIDNCHLIFKIFAIDKKIAKARTAAIDEFFEEQGFCESRPTAMKTTKRGTVIPEYDGWSIDIETRTYWKSSSYYSSQNAIIIRPSDIKQFVEKHPGLMAGYQYAI